MQNWEVIHTFNGITRGYTAPMITGFFRGIYQPVTCSIRIVQMDPGSTGYVFSLIHSDKSVDYMDSLGTVPLNKIYNWLMAHGFRPVRFNRKWLQHPTSSKCWAYSIYFLATRSRGLLLGDILKHFKSNNFEWNGHLVMSLNWHGDPSNRPRLLFVKLRSPPKTVSINPAGPTEGLHTSHWSWPIHVIY